ncbi:MAG: hypothetical protein ACC645_15025 [Pirellulales bacterium]
MAAEALGRYGGPDDLEPALDVLVDAAHVDRHGPLVALFALNALDALGPKAFPVIDRLGDLPRTAPTAPRRVRPYPGRILEVLLRSADRSAHGSTE